MNKQYGNGIDTESNQMIKRYFLRKQKIADKNSGIRSRGLRCLLSSRDLLFT
jgi:hypothetical protein